MAKSKQILVHWLLLLSIALGLSVGGLTGCGGGSDSTEVQPPVPEPEPEPEYSAGCFDDSLYAVGTKVEIDYVKNSYNTIDGVVAHENYITQEEFLVRYDNDIFAGNIVFDGDYYYDASWKDEGLLSIMHYSREHKEGINFAYESTVIDYYKNLSNGVFAYYGAGNVHYQKPLEDRRKELNENEAAVYSYTYIYIPQFGGVVSWFDLAKIAVDRKVFFAGEEVIDIPAGIFRACKYNVVENNVDLAFGGPDHGRESIYDFKYTEWIYRGYVLRRENVDFGNYHAHNFKENVLATRVLFPEF